MGLKKTIEFLVSSHFLLSISCIILILNFIRRNNNFFDIRRVFKDQLDVFDGAKDQIFVFFGVPILLAFGVANYKLIDKDIIDNVVVVLSIILSMLFAILSILTSFTKDEAIFKVVLKETFNSVIFVAILCIMALMISVSVLFVKCIKLVLVNYIVSTVVYCLFFTIMLNIFIIIKRMKSLFDNK